MQRLDDSHSESQIPSNNQTYRLKDNRDGLSAQGYDTRNGKFMLLKGSRIRSYVVQNFYGPKCTQARIIRDELIRDGLIGDSIDNNRNFILTEDYEFENKFTAGRVVFGRSIRASDAWILENDNESSDYYNLNQEEPTKKLREEIENEYNNQNERTEVERSVKQRIGQDKLREHLLESEVCCPFTGIRNKELLRVSHIKPWKDCNDDEKVDSNNCILLSPLWDAAFDKGLVTFDSQGKPKFSGSLCKEAKDIMMGHESSLVNDKCIFISDKRECFLEWHRDNIFRE